MIISARDRITMRQWRTHLAGAWERLMPENTRLLVLAGIHGQEDGRLGDREDPDEDAFVKDCHKQVNILKKAKDEQILQDNIVIEVEDIGKHKERNEFDSDKFIRKVRDFSPTVLLLAFCWSKLSELNDVLRSAGIYTGMVLKEERAQITESRHVELDEGQKTVIMMIAEKKPQNIFLWGSIGAGKTLLLVEALLMKMSQYKREGRQVNIIVTAFGSTSDSALVEDFRNKYLSSLTKQDNVRIVSISTLCREQNVDHDWRQPQSVLTSLLPRLASSPTLTLLLVDETEACGGDWSSFEPCDNVDLMMALQPWSDVKGTVYQVTPPADKHLVLSCQLLTPHRNCHQIRQLHLFLLHHYGSAYLSPKEDVPAPLLPRGRLPLWVQRTEEESDVRVLELVKEEYTNGLSVTVIHGYLKFSEEVREWCQEQGWRYVRDDMITGSEDKCVVLLGDRRSDYLESICRGRNMGVVVTTWGDE